MSPKLAVAAICGVAALLAVSGAADAPGARALPVHTSEFTLEIAENNVELLPGRVTPAFTYNGRVPGPTLEVTEGDHVVVRIINRLDDSTTVHWHGLHLSADADGSPLHPIPPNAERVIEFDIPEDFAGTYWYHPHPHHYTTYQVARGLYGALIVRAKVDPLPPMKEQLLILSDNRFDDSGRIAVAKAHNLHSAVDRENGREGDVIFVNDRILPEIEIRPGEIQRWRIINASASRVYRLKLQGHQLLQVGTDGGLFEVPVPIEELVLANAERAEVLVRGTGAAGSRAMLSTLPYDRYIPQTRPPDWNTPRDLLTLRYSTEPVTDTVQIPARLRVVRWLDTTRVDARRTVVLTQHMINGRHMDPDRVDFRGLKGHTEIWTVENLVGMDHPFHLHGFQFQVLDRNGVPEPFAAWKDVVNVPKHESARFVVRFDDYPGKWMFHCHILDHEDRGMMGILEVTGEEQ